MSNDELAALVGRVRKHLPPESLGIDDWSFNRITVAEIRALVAEVERLAADAKRMRDAEWRAMVERVREESCGPRTATLSKPIHAALDALLAAMEAK